MLEPKLHLSLLDAWLSYEAHLLATLPSKKADSVLAQTRTALLRYTLPGWGFSLPKGQRLTPEECKQGFQLMHQLDLEQLKNASAIQESLFEQLNVAGSSRRNYRWALSYFIDWCKQQSWSGSISGLEQRLPTPRQRTPRGSASDVRVTARKAKRPYQLPRDAISEALQAELDAFYQFLIDPDQSAARPRRALKAESAEQYLRQGLRLLGWLHTVEHIPLEELSLQKLVGVAPVTDEKEQESTYDVGQASADRVVELVRAYLGWVGQAEPEGSDIRRSESQGSYTTVQVLNIWVAIARFVHQQEVEVQSPEEAEDIPVIESLQALRREMVTDLKFHQPISDESKKLMEWSEFLEFVEVLRSECTPRFLQRTQSKRNGTTLGSFRTLTAIAHSYQRFLCAALLAYIPPERQHVLRELEVALLADTNLMLKSTNGSLSGNLLYKEGEQWWLRGGDRKDRESQGQQILVPNICYPDGRFFYDYLEEWLFDYQYQDSQGRSLSLSGLRSCFHPNHAYFFTMKNGQPYSNSSTFMELLRNSAYRIAGKVLTPQVVRQIFYSHLSEKGYGLVSNSSQCHTQMAAEIAQSFIDQRSKHESLVP